jgi:hypothetical protein
MRQEPIAYINVEKRTLEFAEPIKWHTPTVANLDRIPLFTKEALAQTQEPVAVVDVHEFYDNCANFSLLQKLPKGKHTLYTHPPQRTWVGLTDEEIDSYFEDQGWSPSESYYPVIKAIEAKLKERNT